MARDTGHTIPKSDKLGVPKGAKSDKTIGVSAHSKCRVPGGVYVIAGNSNSLHTPSLALPCRDRARGRSICLHERPADVG